MIGFWKKLFKIKLAIMAVLLGLALAHGTVVIGSITTEPTPVLAGQAFKLKMQLNDPNFAPIEKALVMAEFRAEGSDPSIPAQTLHFKESQPGRYEVSTTLPQDGGWQLSLRDHTYPQEEARAVVSLFVGSAGTAEPLVFEFPQTDIGQQGFPVWIIILIGVPILLALIITMRVLAGNAAARAENEVSEPA
jgi:hypothetical protein